MCVQNFSQYNGEFIDKSRIVSKPFQSVHHMQILYDLIFIYICIHMSYKNKRNTRSSANTMYLHTMLFPSSSIIIAMPMQNYMA